jgi:group I intron endonuclease
MSIIYCAVNRVNGKRYIGKTRNALSARRRTHELCSLKEAGVRFCFHRALRKYGHAAFDWEVLFEGVVSRQVLSKLEIDFIQDLQTQAPDGYNMTPGGEGGNHGIEHTRKMQAKAVLANTGSKRSHTIRQKCREAQIKRFQSQEQRQAVGASRKGRTWEEIYGTERAQQKRREYSLRMLGNGRGNGRGVAVNGGR